MNEKEKRKLRVLVITMGSKRQEYIKTMFNHPNMRKTFDPPEFSPGVSSRRLRKRFDFFKIANEAGLLPEQEWNAIKNGQEEYSEKKRTESFFDCLEDVPVTPGRQGSQSDIKLHYSVELWRKAKTINRGRSVLGCTFAHLIAIKKFINDGSYDMILEDNVRVPIEHCAERIRETLDASKELREKGEHPQSCHLLFFGWLGSTPNLKWIFHMHSKKRGHRRLRDNNDISVFPFPLPRDLDEDNEGQEDEFSNEEGVRKPGGNFIWGAYSYWISKEAYQYIMETLRNDVGALLWRNKRARYYSTKPIDKVLPRRIAAKFGPKSVQLSTHPSFFRAPMLTSKIHTQWDPEFCKSTDYQLQHTGITWSNMWLTPMEQEVVQHYNHCGEWLPEHQLGLSGGGGTS